MPETRKILSTKNKALDINLDSSVYGTLAEIGAGQEVARNFFTVGGASGTIAKSMSAYDMAFSDSIYGEEENNRYVSESRVKKMLDHEYDLLTQRLTGEKYAEKRFFAFANTITTLNYSRTNVPHGWVGIRFQLRPDAEPNDIILHIRPYDNNAILQQRVIGEIGVNLIYACYKYSDAPETIIKSLQDNLSTNHIEIDMIRFIGPDFDHVDNRLMSLILVKEGFTDATIFGPKGDVYQPKDLLYKKDVLVLRGRFKPVTKLNWDMLGRAYDKFIEEPDVDKDNVISLAEITLNVLEDEGAEAIIRKDFLDRADILSALGQYVMISNFSKHYKMAEYLGRCSVQKKGIIVGVMNLLQIYDRVDTPKKAHTLLHHFGRMLDQDAKLYLYPYQPSSAHPIYDAQNMPVHDCIASLHEYMIRNGCIEDIDNYNPELLKIFSDDVIAQITAGEDGWEDSVPEHVAYMIKKNCLFDYPCEWVPPKKDFSLKNEQ